MKNSDVTKLRYSNCDQIKNFKFCNNKKKSKTQIMTKLKKSICYKFNNSNCDKTQKDQIVTKLKNSNFVFDLKLFLCKFGDIQKVCPYKYEINMFLIQEFPLFLSYHKSPNCNNTASKSLRITSAAINLIWRVFHAICFILFHTA